MLFAELLLAAGIPLLASAENVINLSGKQWKVTNPQGNVSAPGSLPSHVHLDLFAAGVIRESFPLLFGRAKLTRTHCS
jgi:beta-mannosidase